MENLSMENEIKNEIQVKTNIGMSVNIPKTLQWN